MSTSSGRHIVRAEILTFCTILIWAGNYALSKFAMGKLDFLLYNGSRYLIAAATLAVAFPLFSRWTPIRRTDRWEFFRAGVVVNVLAQMAFMAGLSLTTAGNAAVLLATAPLWTMLISYRLYHERITARMVFGMVLSLIGVVLIILGSGKDITVDAGALFGDFICLAAAAFWALGTTLQKPLVGNYSPYQVTTVLVGIGAVGLSLMSVPSALAIEWNEITWPYYVAVMGSGILSMAAGSVMWAAGVKYLGPSRTSTFGNLLPVLVLGISAITLGERVLLIQLVGAAITIGGVWYAQTSQVAVREKVGE